MGQKMADEKANGELTEDELKADEYKLEANKYFKGRFSITQDTSFVCDLEDSQKRLRRSEKYTYLGRHDFTFPFRIAPAGILK